MELSRLSRLSISWIAAGALTGTIYFIDSKNRAAQQTDLALQCARQMATQVEALSLYAQERHEKDPVAWAARFLTRGIDPRPIELMPLKFLATGSNHSEKYEFNSKARNFSYLKAIHSETGSGIKIQIHLGYLGFLGASTPWMSDLFFGAIFSILAILFYRDRGFRPSSRPRDEKLKVSVLKWTDDARSALLQLGISVKNMTQEARNLVSTTQPGGELAQAAQNMNTQITQTTEAVMKVARMVQDLKNNTSNQEKADSIK